MGSTTGVNPSQQGGGLTAYVFAAAFVAAQAGLIFGYDLVRALKFTSLHVGE